MKKLIIITIFLLVCAFLYTSTAKVKVDSYARKYDPRALPLASVYPPLLRSTFFPNGLQVGIITLADGEEVKFWFASQHVASTGCTRFDFKDGTKKYMTGNYFCCEVQISEEDVKTRSDLISFIETKNGM